MAGSRTQDGIAAKITSKSNKQAKAQGGSAEQDGSMRDGSGIVAVNFNN